MYGMVNKAVEEMVLGAHGESVWREIKTRAGVSQDVFISNEGYPDEVTYSLVAAASAVLQQPAATILFAFGRHWVLNTARKGYGHLMKAGGRNLGEFLGNLPAFHDRVALLYPKLVPPRFEVTHRTERSLHLHYITHRGGLMPFVEGLIDGLGEMFSTPARSTLIASKERGDEHDIFLVEW
jgi:hypothetical protein